MTDPQDLVDALMRHDNFLGKFATAIKEDYKLYGKTTAEWKKYCSIKIQKDASLVELQEQQAKLLDVIDEVSFWALYSQFVLDAFSQGTNEKMDDAFNEALKTYKSKNTNRPPAEGTLRAIANANNSELTGGKAAAQTRVNFFTGLQKKLQQQQKLLETIMWGLSIEAKITHARSI